MRIYAVELNNDIEGVDKRKEYIESLISTLVEPDFIVLPELAICGYIPNKTIWQYADNQGKDTKEWAVQIAKKYNVYIGVGYIDYDQGDFYNRYLIASKNGVEGVVSKSEGESAVFRRGHFDCMISTPFGNIGVAVCYDSRRKNFYNHVKKQELSLIIFPHGEPTDPKKEEEVEKGHDQLCEAYTKAFGVPVIYVNSIGSLKYMPGMMGKMMSVLKFTMNAKTKIYKKDGTKIFANKNGVACIDVDLSNEKIKKPIVFFGDDFSRNNLIFRHFVLKKDTKNGIISYNRDKQLFSNERYNK